MRSIAGVAVVAAALLVSGSALAEAPHYTYVEIGYENTSLDADVSGEDFSWEHDSANGFFVGGQWGNKVFHIFGEYGMSKNDTSEAYYSPSVPSKQPTVVFAGNGTVDSTMYELGFGIHGLTGEKVDLVGEMGYAYTKHDEEDAFGDRYVDSTDGLFFRGGVRARVMPYLEVNGFITNYNLTGVEAFQTFEVNVMGYVWKQLALGGGYSYGNLKLEDSFIEDYRNPGTFKLYLRYDLGPY